MSHARVAIITGAGSGIGRATAVELARRGWNVAIVGRREARLSETVTAMAAANAGSQALPIAADVAQPHTPRQIVDSVQERWGRVDALVNNAATLITGPIHLVSDEALQRSFETNVLAPARLVRAVWPVMARQHAEGAGVGGRVVNVSSMSSIDPFPGLGAYGMSKCALEGLTRAINADGVREGVIAFSVLLGAVETDMLRSFASEKLLPRSGTLEPDDVAIVLASCAAGERDGDAATLITLTRADGV